MLVSHMARPMLLLQKSVSRCVMKAGLYALLIALIALLAVATPIRALADDDGHYARYENGYRFENDRGHGQHKHPYGHGSDAGDRGARACKHGHDCGPQPGYRGNSHGAKHEQPEHYFGNVINNGFQSPSNH